MRACKALNFDELASSADDSSESPIHPVLSSSSLDKGNGERVLLRRSASSFDLGQHVQDELESGKESPEQVSVKKTRTFEPIVDQPLPTIADSSII